MGHGTMLIPHDTIRREILYVHDTIGNPSGELVSKLALYSRDMGHDVIIEGIFVKKKYGDMLEHLIKEFNGDTYIYYFDISFEETLKRHQSKAKATEFGEKEMRSWWVEKDYLKTENERYITDDMTEEEIVELIYQASK